MNSMTNPFSLFEVDEEKLLVDSDGAVPLIHWPRAPNFGDLLSPWLFQKITGRAVRQNSGDRETYISIGSIIGRVTPKCIVWGTGSFGTEGKRKINSEADYRAVRGPLTHLLLGKFGAESPRVYGDPALLTPWFFPSDDIAKTHEIGLVLRWSEKQWLKREADDAQVKIIDLGSDDVEETLRDILSCKRIVTSSLHGLIIADAYGIPSAWLWSDSPKGGEWKFYDHFLVVNKIRHPVVFDIASGDLTVHSIMLHFQFDDRPAIFDPYPLLDACPFLKRCET